MWKFPKSSKLLGVFSADQIFQIICSHSEEIMEFWGYSHCKTRIFLLDICSMRGREKSQLKSVTIILQGFLIRIFIPDFNWDFSLPLTRFWLPGRFSGVLMVFVEWQRTGWGQQDLDGDLSLGRALSKSQTNLRLDESCLVSRWSIHGVENPQG